MSRNEDLVAGEGVDEGSDDTTTEGPACPAGGAVLGAPPHGSADSEATPAPPVDGGPRGPRGPGQQLAEGEG